MTTNVKHGTETVCASPVTSLTPGGVLIDWYFFGLPTTALNYSPGRTVTIAGEPARLASGPADPACARIGGTRSVDAAIEPAMPNGSPSLLHMDACLTRTTEIAPVMAMLRSLRFTTSPAATSPARFPALAADDPYQPLRDDSDLHQPTGNGPLPLWATVTAARWCTATPGPHGEQLTRYQSTGHLAALTKALHAPPTAAVTDRTVCPAGPPSIPVSLEVIDQDGNLFRPTLPVDSCGAISGTPRSPRRSLLRPARRPLSLLALARRPVFLTLRRAVRKPCRIASPSQGTSIRRRFPTPPGRPPGLT